MNFMPQDILLDLPRERYRWTLEAAKKMGVQLIRIWGGGSLETEYLYDLCNEMGIMVWQDFPIGNQDTPDYPQDIWEAEVVQNIVRLRNHPSLVVWCGGNEFNPYAYGNAATLGILERNLDIFDPHRFYVRTTPDDGSMHAYPDMDPTWYNRSYKNEAWVSETGMHSMPEASVFRETVSQKEFFDFGKMWEQDFQKTHPEFIHHFTEYGPARVPRMLSRASHITDVTNPDLDAITEATQVGAGEFYQIMSEKMQGNYPVTARLMPWVFKRHWPVIAIQMMDWFGQAAAPYYFLKRTYEPIHLALELPYLLWVPGESLAIKTALIHTATPVSKNSKISVTIYADDYKKVWQKSTQVASIAPETGVRHDSLGTFVLPETFRNRFFYVVAELTNATGGVISRSVYWPRCLSALAEDSTKKLLREEPATYDKIGESWIPLPNGPWLKPTAANVPTSLTMQVLSNKVTETNQSQLTVRVKNTGTVPSFMTQLDISGVQRAFYASDNFTWLAPGETRDITVSVWWRGAKDSALLTVGAWNVPVQSIKLF